jgi:hypothetical protein
VVFRLNADWMMNLENRKLKRGQICHVMAYIKDGLKYVNRKLWRNLHFAGCWGYACLVSL